MNSVYQIICTRRSIRRFQQKPISKNHFTHILNAGRLAPSGSNLQPCEFILIENKELVKTIFPCLKWAGYISPLGDPNPGEEPVAYIAVLINLLIKRKDGEVDAAASIQNMISTAWGYGIGSCWLASMDKKRIKKELKIPHHLKLAAMIAFGYPKEQPVPEEADTSIKYWKDSDGILHVPKRKLSDICHQNGYTKKLIWKLQKD